MSLRSRSVVSVLICLGFLYLFIYLETVVYAAETSLELELEILLSHVSQ